VDSPQFIVALRNPVDLVLSFHRTQCILLNEDEPDFEVAWRRSLAGGLPTADFLDPKLVDYPTVGRLGRAVSRLLDDVPRADVHFVRFESLQDDAPGVWAALTGFLGLPADPAPSFRAHKPSTKMYRWQTLQRLRHRPPALLDGLVRGLRHRSLRSTSPLVGRLKSSVWWRGESRPQISSTLRAELADYFAGDVDLLAQRIGADMGEWTRP